MTMMAVGIGVFAGSAVLGAGTSAVEQNAAQKSSEKANAPYNQLIAQGEALSQTPYTPYSGQLVAPITGNENAAAALAPQIAGQEAPDLAMAGQQWNNATMQKYMNPYIQGALDPALANITNTYGTQTAALQRTQSMNDAFGVGRTAASQEDLTREYERQYGTTEAQGLAQGYGAAQGAFQADTSRYAALAKTTGALGAENINALLTTGQNQRSVAQAQDTAAYQQFENQQNWGINRFSAAISAINGAKGGLTTAQPADTLGAIMGGATAGLGMMKMMGGGGGGGISPVGLQTDTSQTPDTSGLGGPVPMSGSAWGGAGATAASTGFGGMEGGDASGALTMPIEAGAGP